MIAATFLPLFVLFLISIFAVFLVIDVIDGWKEYLTAYPITHQECCVMKAKFSYHPARRIQLEEVQ